MSPEGCGTVIPAGPGQPGTVGLGVCEPSDSSLSHGSGLFPGLGTQRR